ncbi:DUF6443 domain-containing protein [uncultured Aquimarina sp.]|uniref:DUF6443 domain-containing protein n=1 Tax=uncultured Aquimarina sp. TaxID=575652 RepID=UPI00262B5233|nr:DUF6443 domain-containing protein [uncultured Aquimarina sp.]
MNTKYIYLILTLFITLPAVAQLGGARDGGLIGSDGDKVKFYRDADGDGYGNNNTLSLDIKYAPTAGYVSNHTDCDDTKASINPGITWYRDSDGDGYGTNSITKKQCYQPSGYVSAGGDYNDGNALITNIAPRNFYRDADGDSYGDYSVKTYRSVRPNGYVTNNKDCNDSNASLNLLKTWYRDSDGDGYGSEYLGSIVIGQAPRQSCAQPSGYVLNKLDCNDSNAAIRPNTVWYRDADGDGYGIASSTKTGCSVGLGYVLNKLDCNDSNASLNPNTVWYRDADNDGWGNKNVTKKQCSRPSGYVSNDDDYNDGTNLITNIAPRNFYRDADNDSFGHPTNKTYRSTRPNGYVTNSSDCNDNSAAINPNTFWYRDADGDGFGNSSVTKKQCTQPSGYVLNDDDLNDSNSLITTITPMHFYRDADNDTFGNPANSKYQSIQPSGYVVNSSDCNDNDSSLNPNTRWYRDADNDGWGNASVLKKQCIQPSGYVRNDDDYDDNNNLITNIAPRTFYADSDLDTYGNPSASIYRSVQPGSYVTNNSDCNDNDAAINPNTKWYRDADADGWGNASIVKTQCVQPSGYVRNDDDNDDSNNLITNITPSNFYRDADQDTFGTNTDKKYQSEQPSGFVTNNRDCDDSNASINPNTVWYVDNDGDGWGNRLVTKTQCTQPAGYVENNTDVDDTTSLITNLTPSTFYKDTDNDGFGEPDNTILASLQPVGYVGNSLDQCPDEMGNYGGCISRPYNNVVFSDENYVFTRAYQAPMQSSSAIKYDKDVIESITYFDGLGRAKQQIGINASATSSNTINNELPMDWAEGSGSTAFFNQNGATAENHRIRDVDPRGERSLVWRCGNDEYNNADGGWNTDYFAVDKNVGYRYSVWVKRTGSQNGATYHGTQNVNNLSGTANNNPYFWASDLPELDTWYMVVGVIHPYQYGGDNTGVSGVYDINGTKVLNGHEFKWRDNTTTSRFRSYLYYSTDVRTRQYFWKPLVQKLDGTETSLKEMFASLNQNPKDIVTHIEYDALGRQAINRLPYVSKGTSGTYNVVDISNDINAYYLKKYNQDFTGVTKPEEVNPFSETIFETSPLGRTLEQAAPGTSWKYDANNVALIGAQYKPMPRSYYGFTNKQWYINYFFDPDKDQPEEGYDNDRSPKAEVLIDHNNILTFTVVGTINSVGLGEPEATTLILGDIDNVRTAQPLKEVDLGNLIDGNGQTTSYHLRIINNTFVLTSDTGQSEIISSLNTTITVDLNEPVLEDYNEKISLNKTIKFDYKTNGTNEVVNFDIAGTATTVSLVKTGFYTVNTLFKNIIRDENWQLGQTYPKDYTTEEFKDKSGRVILKRTYNTGVAHDTYYVYDKLGNLTFVLPPKVTLNDGVSSNELNELCYQYKYDSRNRLVEKKIPGKGWEYIVYNKLDQPVLTQDANLKAQSAWLFTKYDALGRVAYTGTLTDNRERDVLQQEANDFTNDLWVEKGNELMIGGVAMYYTNGGFPSTQNSEVLTINYYDDYNFDIQGLMNPGTVYEQPVDNRTKSLATGSKVKVLGTNDWITTVTYYDSKTRPIYQASKNEYLHTTDIVESKLDFTGRIEQSRTTHTKDANAPIVTIDTFTYDHVGRLIDQTQSVNGQEELVAENLYDELGQLIAKKVGGGLQTVDYKYNVRGWLTDINDVNNIGDDLFSFRINYNTPTQNLGAAPLFNGNISETIWKTANDNTKRAYGYQYDALNRIKRADHSDQNYNASYAYDKNGNLTFLERDIYSNFLGEKDRIEYSYQYQGNQLTELRTYQEEFDDHTTRNYQYDTNGNMKIDIRNYTGNTRGGGVRNIDYNHLNLPTAVAVNNYYTADPYEYNDTADGNITYIYDATGAKLKKIVTEGSSLIETEYAGNYIYKNGILEFMNHPEGYIEPSSSSLSGAESYDYVYQLKDHLGNIRLSFSDKDKDGKIDVLRNNADVDGDGDNVHEILEEKNYYPFGLQHKGYNNMIVGTENNHKEYQGQEYTEDLDLNIHEWTFRFSDPSIGRFWQIDPLAEDYNYQSPYNFSENRVIDAVELEGLEKVLVIDIDERPQDNGTSGTTYTGEIYVLNEETGNINGPYEASSYPNSKSNSDNSTSYNTLNEGEHIYNNASGHSEGTEKGLNIVNENGDRVAEGTDPNANDVEMTVVNVHDGQSDNGNYNSRGSAGCITCNPDVADDLWSNFNWTTSTTGDSSGTIKVVRGNATERTNAVKWLKGEGSIIKTKNFHAQKAKQRKLELKGHF